MATPLGEGLVKQPRAFPILEYASVEPNGAAGQGQQQQFQQQAQQPVQQQQQHQGYQTPIQLPPQQQAPQGPATPQFNVVPINPQTGQPNLPPAPATPVQTQADAFSQFRQQVATSLGVQVSEVPSDPAQLAKVVQGGYAAAQRLQQLQASQQNGQQVQQQPVQQQATPNPLQPKPMAPGWEQMVQRNAQTGVYEPVHPNFQSIASDANYNVGVYAQRNVALSQGQMLPEQQQSVQDIIQKTLAKEREELRASMFMEANEQKLFAMNPDGTRQMQLGVDARGQQAMMPVASELGIEMQNAAREIVDSGAQFNSQHDLAKYALKIAEGRLKQKQAQSQNGNGHPPAQAQPMNNDLASLLNSHRQTGNMGGGNLNTLPQQRSQDPRADFRAMLQNMPDGGNGVDYLNYLRGRG